MKEATSVVAILASAVIVLGGLVALVRSLLRIRDELRDNTHATRALTGQMDALLGAGGRLETLETRVGRLERRRARSLD